MRRHNQTALSPLAISLALALGSDAIYATGAPERTGATATHSANPSAPSAWTVQNCNDDGANSLRDLIENKAQSGDTIDLSLVPSFCGVPSVITLSSGQIVVAQNDLKLQGSTEESVTISGGHNSRVFEHSGSGLLMIERLTVADGNISSNSSAYGGCIDSPNSGIYLVDSTVTGCVVTSIGGVAYGGGVSAFQGYVTLVRSSIVGNEAVAPQAKSNGGGVYALNVVSNYSSISANAAQDGLSPSQGGGIFAGHQFSILSSTIDHNEASYGSAIWSNQFASVVANTTISSNESKKCGAVFVEHAPSLTFLNSTIASNSNDSMQCGAIFFYGLQPGSELTLQSSIVANNTAAGQSSDIYVYPGHGTLSGANNLVVASNVSAQPGVITVTADPQLGPLQANGGFTHTHALLPGSPAIGAGNATALPPWIPNDQRGPGYPRTTGASALTDIGAFEFDTIFSGGFDID